MNLLDYTLPAPAENLALDEALLAAAEEDTGGEVLRLWELPSYAVVVGSGGSSPASRTEGRVKPTCRSASPRVRSTMENASAMLMARLTVELAAASWRAM